MLFISYAHIDVETVKQLVEVLEAGGNSVWFDHQLLPGQDWMAELYNAINLCKAFVYTLTDESVASEWCQWEFANAVKLKKPIIPILFQKKVAIPKPIERFQYVDFSEGATPLAVAKLIGGIHAAQLVPIENTPKVPDKPKGLPSRVWGEEIKHWTDTIVQPKHSPQNDNEQIIEKFAANLQRGWESVGGRLIVTNQRVLFESHGFNIHKEPVSIPHKNISGFSKKNTLGIVRNGLVIHTNDGKEYYFVVNVRDKIIELVQQYLTR